jgi:undecaprenyl-diphosphatase
MTVIQSLLFGVVEGLTEFIPVSSTAHMLFLQQILGIPASDAVFAFLVLVQLGPLVALLVYFWRDLWNLLLAFFSRPFATAENRLAWYIIIGTIPALVAGALLKDSVQSLFRNPLGEAAIRFFAAAALLALAEWLGRRTRTLDAMAWFDSLVVGLFQVLAVFPGASRSGSTISAGMLRNFDRPAATRFAFLLSAPVMFAAGLYESVSAFRLGHLGALLLPLALGLIVAAIVGWLSIRWLLKYVSTHSLYAFAVYCTAVGCICLVILVTG